MCSVANNLIETGLEKGREETIFGLVQKGRLTLQEGVDELNLSEKEFCERMEAAGYHVPAMA